MSLENALLDSLTPTLKALAAFIVAEFIANGIVAEDRLAFPRAEAAEKLGVGPHVLRDAEARGELTGSKVGSKTVYPRDELIAFLIRQRIAH